MKKYLIAGADLLCAFMALELIGFTLFLAVLVPPAVAGGAPPTLLVRLFLHLFAPMRWIAAFPLAGLPLLALSALLFAFHIRAYRRERTGRHAGAAAASAITCAASILLVIELLS